jgi:hypothetical protein
LIAGGLVGPITADHIAMEMFGLGIRPRLHILRLDHAFGDAPQRYFFVWNELGE